MYGALARAAHFLIRSFVSTYSGLEPFITSAMKFARPFFSQMGGDLHFCLGVCPIVLNALSSKFILKFRSEENPQAQLLSKEL
jgi:hypothetical protein